MKKLLASLKYALYVIFHPFDGFWDLTHESRGSVGAANVITVLMVAAYLCSVTMYDFQHMLVRFYDFNIILFSLRIIAPLLLWCVTNWAITTLFDGKGKLIEIYMGTAYAFTPYIICSSLAVVLSHVLAYDEGVVLTFLNVVGVGWSVGLLLAAVMMIHDYSLTKAVLSSLATIAGIGVVMFVFSIFVSLISDGIAYFVSLAKEIMFRMN